MNTSAPACWWQYMRARFFAIVLGYFARRSHVEAKQCSTEEWAKKSLSDSIDRLIDIYLEDAPAVSQRAEKYLRNLGWPALRALWDRWQVASIPRHTTDLWWLITKMEGVRSTYL